MTSDLARTVGQRGAALAAGKSKTMDEFIQQYAADFGNLLPANSIDQGAFVRLALNSLRYNEKLREVEPASLIGALMTTAQLGLQPTGPLEHVYLLPFRANAGTKEQPRWVQRVQLIIGYNGYIELATRTGKVRTIVGRPVFKNDYFSHTIHNGQDTVNHKPTKLGEDPGPLIGTYATATLMDGSIIVRVCAVDEIEAARKRSKSGGADDPKGPWTTDYITMAVKTSVRRLWKWIPKSSEGAAAFNVDAQVVAELPDREALMAPPPILDEVSGPTEHVVLDAEETTEPATPAEGTGNAGNTDGEANADRPASDRAGSKQDVQPADNGG